MNLMMECSLDRLVRSLDDLRADLADWQSADVSPRRDVRGTIGRVQAVRPMGQLTPVPPMPQ